VYELLQNNPKAFDPRVFLTPVMHTVMTGEVLDEDVSLLMARMEAGVKEAVGSLIINFESYGKAPLIEEVSLEEMARRYKREGR